MDYRLMMRRFGRPRDLPSKDGAARTRETRTSSGEIDRRTFGRLFAGATAAVLTGCTGEDRRTTQDHDALERQQVLEARQSGRGPFGPQRYRGYRGLAELPFYELDEAGNLRCTSPDIPRAIDFHAHLGMALLFAPDLDLLANSERVRHLLDSDGYDPPLPFDLDVYANANFTDEELRALQWGAAMQLTFGSERAATHTVPNLLAEMDACRVERACLLPIAFGLPMGDALSEKWIEAIRNSGASSRFIRGASVHPRDPERLAKLRELARKGCRIVKLHPAAQRFYADSQEAMELYETCGELGLIVFFHAGRAGIEPDMAQRYNLVRAIEPGLRRFPDVPFVLGHAGARDVAEAIPLAKRYRNAWLGIHGQGLSQLAEIVERVGPDRLLFGSDWPFYAIAATQAKVLILSEGNPELRYAILRGNAERLLASTEPT